MSSTSAALEAAARACCSKAHGPYSGIRVGAAIRSAKGATFTGVNVENAAFPLGNCAEASAIAAGVLTEGADFRIAEIAVYAESAGGEIAASPCGGCRQRIREFVLDESVAVHFCGASGRQMLTIGELLPHSFRFPAAPGKR